MIISEIEGGFCILKERNDLRKTSDEVVDGFRTMRRPACDDSRFLFRCRMINVDAGTAPQKRIAKLPFVVGRDDGKRRMVCLDLAEARDR